MPIDILMTVAVTTLIQSVFGVGVLLFGTPLLLLLGYDFINTVSILLPVSLAINTLQLIKHYHYIDIVFYRKLLIYTMPFVILGLLFVSTLTININLLVGGFLILIAIKNYFSVVEKRVSPAFNYEKTYLVFMGILHGLTNLGGSLLTAIVHQKKQDKHVTRATIAISYATFALFQLATLLFIDHKTTLTIANQSHFVQIGIVVFLCAEELVYNKLDNQKYNRFFALFLFVSGVVLILK